LGCERNLLTALNGFGSLRLREEIKEYPLGLFSPARGDLQRERRDERKIPLTLTLSRKCGCVVNPLKIYSFKFSL
jgi:hypothetical protein